MSQQKIWSYTLPAALVLICLFQNCSGGSFDVMNPVSNANFSSSVPGNPGDGTLPGGVVPPGTPVATPAPGATPPPVGNLPPDPSDAGRRILKVCPSGCPYSVPSAAAAAAMDNDIIEVAAADYNDCFDLYKNNIKLRGVNGRAHLTGKTCGGKSEINLNGTNTVIESFEFSGMTNGSANGSGIRGQGTGLIVRNCYFHDGEEGILSSPLANTDQDTILVENSKFERLGGDTGHSHAVYFGPHRQIFVRNSLFLSGKDQGHEFKSRAQNSSINCSIFASLDGLDSYTLNFPDAGNAEVKNSTVEQGPATSNPANIDYGSESTSRWGLNQLVFSNVNVMNDGGGNQTYFQVKGTSLFTITDSILAGPGSKYNSQTATESNLHLFSSRSGAGFGAYPSLPTPTGCGNIGLSF